MAQFVCVGICGDLIHVYAIDIVSKERPDTLHSLLCRAVLMKPCTRESLEHYDVGAWHDVAQQQY